MCKEITGRTISQSFALECIEALSLDTRTFSYEQAEVIILRELIAMGTLSELSNGYVTYWCRVFRMFPAHFIGVVILICIGLYL